MVVNLDYVLFQNSGFLGYTRNNSECLIFQYVLLPPFAGLSYGRRGQQCEGSTFF